MGSSTGAKSLLSIGAAIINRAPTTTTVQARNLQRRDGSRPSGNSSKMNGRRVSTPANPSGVINVTILRGAGNDPGSTTRA
jgi:hypothetical protein